MRETQQRLLVRVSYDEQLDLLAALQFGEAIDNLSMTSSRNRSRASRSFAAEPAGP